MNTNPPGRWSRFRRCAFVALLVGTATAVASPSNALTATDIDTKADPRADFVRYANGLWLDKTTIPSDRPGYGSFDEVGDPLDAKLLAILRTPQSSADGQKLAALFAQATNIEARNTAGLKPIAKDLRQIRTAKTLKQLFAVGDGIGPLAPFVSPVPSDPSTNALTLGGPQLGLGSRDFYLGKDSSSKAIQQAYVSFLDQQLKFAGYSTAAAKKESQRVFALEKTIAGLYLDPRVLAANYELANVPISVKGLQKLTPSVDWTEVISLANLTPESTVILTEPSYIKKLESVFKKVPLSTAKALQVSQLLVAAGPYLSDDIGELQFAFFGKALNGQEQRAPLERRALGQVGERMPDAIGKLYVEQHFSEAAKTEVVTMTQEVLTAFRGRIESNKWMSTETKAKAIEKLSKVKVRVAYPDRFLTYDNVALGASYVESVQNFGEASLRVELAKVGKPVDQSNWGPVAWVNAFYNPTDNTINFPAGILAGVFFDVKNDPAANFGAIGAVIGHELTHGFDISGSQFDGDGRLVSWRTEADRKSFEGLNARLASQFSAIKIPDVGTVDGTLTVGENVADLGGVQVAYDALVARLGKIPDPGVIDGLTQKQRFFVAWAQAWKDKSRPEFAKFLLTADVHSPASVRATQPLRNMDAFYEAFGIKEGDAMWLPPADRITIW
jgi:putative endopeptidase